MNKCYMLLGWPCARALERRHFKHLYDFVSNSQRSVAGLSEELHDSEYTRSFLVGRPSLLLMTINAIIDS
jgi:hypothetical protein